MRDKIPGENKTELMDQFQKRKVKLEANGGQSSIHAMGNPQL